MKDSTTDAAARKKVLDAVDGAINLLMRSGRDGLICADKLNAVRPTIATLTQQQGGDQEAGGGVTDDMVERACEAYLAEAKRQNFNPSEVWARSQQAKDWMRAALTAALRTKQPAASEGDVAKLVRDLAENGLRYSLDPCHDWTSKETIFAFWRSYMSQADKSIRERAAAALQAGTP